MTQAQEAFNILSAIPSWTTQTVYAALICRRAEVMKLKYINKLEKGISISFQFEDKSKLVMTVLDTNGTNKRIILNLKD